MLLLHPDLVSNEISLQAQIMEHGSERLANEEAPSRRMMTTGPTSSTVPEGAVDGLKKPSKEWFSRKHKFWHAPELQQVHIMHACSHDISSKLDSRCG